MCYCIDTGWFIITPPPPTRTHAKCLAEADATAGVRGDPAAGQLSRVLHPRHALPDGGDPRGARLLRPGWYELLWPGTGWGRGQVTPPHLPPRILVYNQTRPG